MSELANMIGKGNARTNIDYIFIVKVYLTLGKKANYLFDTGELGFDLKTEMVVVFMGSQGFSIFSRK